MIKIRITTTEINKTNTIIIIRVKALIIQIISIGMIKVLQISHPTGEMVIIREEEVKDKLEIQIITKEVTLML